MLSGHFEEQHLKVKQYIAEEKKNKMVGKYSMISAYIRAKFDEIHELLRDGYNYAQIVKALIKADVVDREYTVKNFQDALYREKRRRLLNNSVYAPENRLNANEGKEITERLSPLERQEIRIKKKEEDKRSPGESSESDKSLTTIDRMTGRFSINAENFYQAPANKDGRKG